MSPEDIKKYCYLNNRFKVAIKKIVSRHGQRFSQEIVQCLSAIIEIARKTDQYRKSKSDAYLYDFMDQNPSINLLGNNPFYVISFNAELEISIVYIIIEECRLAGVSDLILPGNDLSNENIVCAFDLFDGTKEESFSAIKPVNSYHSKVQKIA